MALQKRRLGRTRIHHRRSAWMRLAQSNPNTQLCPTCEEPKLPHRICMKCGTYKGKEVIAVATDGDE